MKTNPLTVQITPSDRMRNRFSILWLQSRNFSHEQRGRLKGGCSQDWLPHGARRNRHECLCYGKANATYFPPDGAPDLPPPAPITTNWRPFTSYVAGVAFPAAGSVVSHNSLPVALSKAWNFLS